jgi:hypothetical protein
VHNIRHNTPKAIVPVIDSMLAEVGGLGYVFILDIHNFLCIISLLTTTIPTYHRLSLSL